MNAMVCGSSQGIGASSAIELSKSGVSVTLVARNKDALKGILLELDRTSNQSHDYIVADFDDPQKLELLGGPSGMFEERSYIFASDVS